jgi:serine/threonine protein kinase
MSDMVDAVGRRYEIVCRLAGGGMADLYLGRSRGPGGFERVVVIKRLAKRLEGDPRSVQALLDEARIAATLCHANIVQVTDIEIADGQVSIVMEFLHGHDVSHLLRKLRRGGERVPLDQAVAIVLAVCAGLHHAHERVDGEGKSLRIVHRDVSPHNVLVTYDGAIKLVDFGIARASVRQGHTEAGYIKGKPGYISPEQIRGRKLDRRADVWGAAVLLYELTTGETPYGTSSQWDDLAKVTKHDAPLPSTKIEDYPPELEAIVMKGLAREPAQRYQTADEMRIALESFARAHGLDLSPFRMAALMERVFAQNIEAWRQSQQMGRSLAEHVAAFKTSGAHEMIELPGEPTEPMASLEATRTLATADVIVITAETKLIRPSAIRDAIAAPPVEAPQPEAQLEAPPVTEASAATTVPHSPVEIEPIASVVEPNPWRPWWRHRIAIGVATFVALVLGIALWPSAPQADRPREVEADKPRATAVNDQPVAQPIIVVPIEPEPATTQPVASEPMSESDTAVAHAATSPARKRPAAKAAAKRRPPRPSSHPETVEEDDLDALLPH